jgi:Uma2 family endonuclease
MARIFKAAMSEAAHKLGYTWDDYRRWEDGKRWEVIGGEAFAMMPAPSTRHQGIVGEISRQLGDYCRGKSCRPFVSPIDVKLSEEDMVQPDVIVVCDRSQTTRTHIEGAPALVIEVLSESTALYDRGRKMALYARSGVKEVWLVTPYPSVLEVYVLADGGYRLQAVYGKDDTLVSPAFAELKLALASVFDFPLEPGEEVQLVREGRPAAAAR